MAHAPDGFQFECIKLTVIGVGTEYEFRSSTLSTDENNLFTVHRHHFQFEENERCFAECLASVHILYVYFLVVHVTKCLPNYAHGVQKNYVINDGNGWYAKR